MKKIGIYYYPWYRSERWRQHRKCFTPRIGEYDSNSEILIDYHIGQIESLGVDFVIVEILPQSDWDFESTYGAARRFVNGLKNRGISFSLLIDTAVGGGHENSVNELSLLLNRIEDDQMMPTVLDHGIPLIYLFSTPLSLACEVREMLLSRYHVLFPIFLPDWKACDSNATEFLRLQGFDLPTDASRAQALPLLGYVPFWQPIEQFSCMNGTAAVIPGYDDLLLKRYPQLAPIVPRADGRTLADQFKQAIDSGAENILIYGWNEYFESTTIEPTLEYGDFYLDLTRELIRQVKEGGVIHIPEGIGTPSPATPVYLSPELEMAAQLHPDKIPRWDQDEYLSDILLNSPVEKNNGLLLFRKITVINAGIKVWRIVSKSEPIRLGVRLSDENGNVVREGRAEIGLDVPSGLSVIIDLSVDVSKLMPGNYRADIDMVHEGKHWFGNSKQVEISF